MSAQLQVAAARPAFRSSTLVLVARRAVPGLLALGIVAPSLVWIGLDRSIWPWDPAWYGQVSVELWAAARGGPSWSGVMTHAFGAKPPAIAWFGQFFVPLRHVVGGDANALLLSVVICQALAVWLLFVSLTRLRGTRAAAVGALALGSAPLYIAMSHEYFAEPIQTISTAWILFILASASTRRPAFVLAQLPGALAFGLLAKLSAPLYLAAPTVGVLFLVLAHRKRSFGRPAYREPAVLLSFLASGVLVLSAAAWYRINLDAAVAHARASSANNGLYGVDRGFVNQLPDWFGHLRDVAFLPHVGLVVAALSLAAVLVAAREKGRTTLTDPRLVCALACAASIVLVLASFASQPNQELRYLLPLIPFVATLVGLAVGAPRTRLFAVTAAAVLVVQFTVGTLQSFGTANRISWTSYPIVAPTAKTAFAQTLDDIVTRTCTPATSYKINMVGVDYPWLNANTLTLLAAERFDEGGRYCYYTALGYASSDPEAAWQRVVQFKPPFFIGLDYGNRQNPLPPPEQQTIVATDPFNRVNLAVSRRARASGTFHLVPGTKKNGTVVLVGKQAQ